MSDTPQHEGPDDLGPAVPPSSAVPPPPKPGYAPSAQPTGAPPSAPSPAGGRSNTMLFVGTAAGLVIAIVMTLVVLLGDDEDSSSDSAGSASSSAPAKPSASPGDSPTATSSPSRTPTATPSATATDGPTASVPPTGGFQNSPVLAAARVRGRLIVGTKGDTPGLSFQDPATGRHSGFEIELALAVAEDLGFDEDGVEFRNVPSAARETALASGGIDLYIGTYSITALRKQTVAFAGPYYVAGLTALVRAGEPTITGMDSSLAGRTVCSVTGSTPLQVVQTNVPQAQVSGRTSYAQCLEDLQASRVDAVVTDDAILRGYAAVRPSELKVVGTPFGVEKYGIGMNHDDAALRSAVNDALEKAATDGTWSAAYTEHLDPTRTSFPAPPPLDRY
ncbi:glutamate ABC transporter substrate-binding protein [Streptodolium elevatio]|uniref:Glutamate ABC transporter substrate-binding protein n=1 Tax=Streptodolium elevatio TaxID=3157996 RepID=A0ABV3DFZ5_9ACTN